jgi:hypothetical protein
MGGIYEVKSTGGEICIPNFIEIGFSYSKLNCEIHSGDQSHLRDMTHSEGPGPSVTSGHAASQLSSVPRLCELSSCIRHSGGASLCLPDPRETKLNFCCMTAVSRRAARDYKSQHVRLTDRRCLLQCLPQVGRRTTVKPFQHLRCLNMTYSDLRETEREGKF